MFKNSNFSKMFGIVAVLAICLSTVGVVMMSESEDSDAAGTLGSSSSPVSSFSGTVYGYSVIHIYKGSSFSMEGAVLPEDDEHWYPTAVSSGFGLTLNTSAEKISGTLSKTGTITISYTCVTLTTEELVTSGSVTVYVYATEAELDFTSPEAVDCLVGSTVNYTPTVNVTGSTFSKTSGASWLTLSNGKLTGTAPSVTTVTNYNVVIKATSPGGQTVSQNVTFTVYPVMKLTASTLTGSCIVESALNSITVTSNVSMNTISVTKPTSGFTVTKSTSTTASFSGTPTVTGTFSFKFTATSSVGPTQTAYVTVTITVVEKTLTITSSYPTAIYPEGTSYSYTPTANQSVTWTLSDGPSWLALSSGSVVGSINGIETGQTTLSYILTATTPGGQIATQTVTINVEDTLVFTSVPTASCVVIPIYSYNDDGSYYLAIIMNLVPSVDASDGSQPTNTYMFVFVGENAEVVTWDFGDGTTAEGFNVTHSYAVSGTYTYTCTATNSLGSDSVNGEVTVSFDKTTDYLLYCLIGILVLLILYIIIKARKSHRRF